MEDAFKLLDWKGLGININGQYITHLRFADDIVVMAKSMEELGTMLEGLNRVSQRVSLKLNMDSKLEVVDAYVYLGQTVQLGRSNF